MTTTHTTKLENGFTVREVWKQLGDFRNDGIFSVDIPFKYIKTIYDKKGKKIDNYQGVF